MKKTLVMMVATLGLLATTGCGDKDAALKGIESIEAACKAGKKAEASKLGKELLGNNKTFKKASEGASKTWKVKDPSTINFCGAVMVEIKSRVKNAGLLG